MPYAQWFTGKWIWQMWPFCLNRLATPVNRVVAWMRAGPFRWLRSGRLPGGPHRSTLWLGAILGASVGWFGCVAQPRPSRPPQAVSPPGCELLYQGGPTFAPQPEADIDRLRPEDAFAVDLTLLPLTHCCPDGLRPIEQRARLIAVSPRSVPVTPVTQLLRGARVGSVQAPEQFAAGLAPSVLAGGGPAETRHAVLPAGVTLAARITHPNDLGSGQRESLEIRLHRPPTTPEPQPVDLVIARTGSVPPVPNLPSQAPSSDQGPTAARLTASPVEMTTEEAFLELSPAAGSRHFAVVLPSPFGQTDIQALAVILSVREFGAGQETEAYRTAFGECIRQLRSATTVRQAGTAPSDPRWTGMVEALADLTSSAPAPLWRRSLVYLATAAQAHLAEDLALSAEYEVARRLVRGLAEAYAAGTITDANALSWQMEKQAYLLLGSLDETGELTPALRALLLRHAGQLGRDLVALQELVATARSREALEDLLVREHQLYLEDISPAARNRAFEWLRARGKAPLDFDPLASARERRAVLDRYNNQRENQ
jgi:hypothetical protein